MTTANISGMLKEYRSEFLAQFDGSKWPLYFSTFLLAACSILYELLIAHALSLLAANTVVWYSVTVGLFLLGMGLGSFVSDYLGKKNGPKNSLVTVELLLSLLGILAVPIVHFGHTIYLYAYVWNYGGLGIVAFYGSAFLTTLIIGFLTGIELPLLMRIHDEEDAAVEEVNENDGIRASASTLLGIDYLGSLIGALAFPMVLLPHFELLTIGFTVCFINIAVATFFLASAFRPRFLHVCKGAVTAALVLLSVTAIIGRKDIEQYFLKRFYYYYTDMTDSFSALFKVRDDLPDIFRASSPYQKIDIVTEVMPQMTDVLLPAYSSKFDARTSFSPGHYLLLNGDYQLHTNYEEIYHEFFAHVPIIASGHVPKEVLVMGGGDGFLVRELLKYDEIEHITHIDLDPTLIDTSNSHKVLLDLNEGAFLDDRVDTTFTDGYQYVRNTDKKFDAVYIDFPAPADYNLAKLYSREFFTFVKRRIKDDGFGVFDATGIGFLFEPNEQGNQRVDMSYNDWPQYYHTLKAAGVEQIVPYITTLDFENLRAKEAIRKIALRQLVPELTSDLIQEAETNAEKRAVLNALARTAVDSIIKEHVMSLQQGFIILAHEDKEFSKEYIDFGTDLHVLDEGGFKRAFQPKYPRTEEIKEEAVNSIMRPTFPTTPLFEPRVPL